MIAGADTVLARLDQSIADAQRYAATVKDPEKRYALASAKLITGERDNLAVAISKGDAAAVRWALGLIAGMMKGLIDIGSSWSDVRPTEWEWVHQTTSLAHTLEQYARQG